MEKINGTFQLSASDLVRHLACSHSTALELAASSGTLPLPKIYDPLLEVLLERGARHERDYVAHLAASGLAATVIEGKGVDKAKAEQTLAAMRGGVDVIVQGALMADGWGGRADILYKVASDSSLGGWSYEIIDTKLARETKGGTLLQLCLYADLLADAQGVMPEHVAVVAPLTGFQPERFRTADFSAYYRFVKRSLERTVVAGLVEEGAYPGPIPQCDICRWRRHCDRRRRADDHLSLVANISDGQIEELKRRQISTMAALAAVSLPLAWKPERGAAAAYERLCEQARLQVAARITGRPTYETLPVEPESGFSLLPAPSEGDIFLDFEGDPFVGEQGLEYLFGYSFLDAQGEKTHVADWALDRQEEKVAFERLMDFVTDRLMRYPDLHIYHYAPYEPSALKRLMGRYATREAELDRLLRGQVFVDLFAIVRHALRVGVESYSIKKLEPLYGFVRAVELPEANLALTKMSARLELGDTGGFDDRFRAAVEGYNRDDCRSTWELRDFLESVRAEVIAAGTPISRPLPGSGEASEALNERQQRVAALSQRIAGDVPAVAEDRNAEQQARWLLANLLDFYRREKKSLWWERFRLQALSADELLDERAGLAGLTFLGACGGTERAPIHRYSFPPQESDLRGGEELHLQGGGKLGSIDSISFAEGTVAIKKRGDTVAVHPAAVFAHSEVRTDVLEGALLRLGEHVAEHGITGPGQHEAARNLLLRQPPRSAGGALRAPEETPVAAAIRLATELDETVLPIQGPPGAGKTYTAARMICALVKAGRRVGVTANSHKVIENLMAEVLKAADETGVAVECVHKVNTPPHKPDRIRHTTNNGDALAAISLGGRVVGGTAWLWARPEAADTLDVLFVDEAAQMSLANVMAVAQAANSLVLLGDPRQLEQPIQGSHPEGTDVSALDHLLIDPAHDTAHLTIPEDKGLFLGETWRLNPKICAFTSEVFYEGRLHARAGLDIQQVRSAGRMSGSGLKYLSVEHTGNRSASSEEAEVVRQLVEEILAGHPSWTDRNGTDKPLTLEDILIVAPYNAQVFELQCRLPTARIGTVDKFQGQEAPIVICSMTTSSAADAPHGLEFLYSLNRLNVATSRAKCVCILVASPALFEAECRTPRQMQLVNAFCRYLELATRIWV